MNYYNPYMLYFGSPSCHKCIESLVKIRRSVDLNESNFKFINGDDLSNDEVQKFCDEHGVDEYPHIKIYLRGELMFEQIGDLDTKEISERMTNKMQIKNVKK